MNTWRLTCGVLLVVSGPLLRVASASELEDQGKALLTRLCARCHAVERTGASPHAGADMPDFQFSRADAQAVRAYLYSIQQ